MPLLEILSLSYRSSAARFTSGRTLIIFISWWLSLHSSFMRPDIDWLEFQLSLYSARRWPLIDIDYTKALFHISCHRALDIDNKCIKIFTSQHITHRLIFTYFSFSRLSAEYIIHYLRHFSRTALFCRMLFMKNATQYFDFRDYFCELLIYFTYRAFHYIFIAMCYMVSWISVSQLTTASHSPLIRQIRKRYYYFISAHICR